jgi:hypothetical protein
MGLDTKTDWPTDRRSQRDSDSDSAAAPVHSRTSDTKGVRKTFGKTRSPSEPPTTARISPTQPELQGVLFATRRQFPKHYVRSVNIPFRHAKTVSKTLRSQHKHSFLPREDSFQDTTFAAYTFRERERVRERE